MRWLRFPPLLPVTVLFLLFALQAAAQVRVLTGLYDNARTGQNLQETVLTPQNVNSSSFGKLFSWPVDGDVYAQPLYLPGVQVPGQGTRNLVLIATEHDSVYAFDADATTGSAPVWHVNFLNASKNITSAGSNQIGCNDMIPEVGITGTPVIDPASGTMYLVAATSENGTIVNRLHALDVATGTEKPGSPVLIQARTAGTGAGSSNGFVSFNAAVERQRSALLLLNGALYINWASYCDHGVYHGWVMSYDAQSLTQLSVFCSTSNGSEGGIWESSSGPSTDSSGNIYEATGNGTFDGDSGGLDWGDSVLRLNNKLQVDDYFTPSNQATLAKNDQDLGSSAPVVLPDQPGAHPHLTVLAGKAGTLYLLNRDGLGGYNTAGDQIVQELNGVIQGARGGPAYWNGTLYYAASGDHLKAFPLRNGLIASSSVTQSTTTFGYPGSLPAVSANGNQNGIVWVMQVDQYPKPTFSGGPAILHAYDATNVAHELYNSSQAGSRDQAGTAVKFVVPTIANGRVYVGTRNEVDVYGLLTAPPPTPDFSMSLTPASSTVNAGSNASLTATTAALNGYSHSLTLTCTAPASGCQVSPASLTPGQSATVTISASALQNGANTITVVTSDGTLSHSASATVTVSASSSGLPVPAISNLTDTSVTLSWTTAQALNTQVWYGTAQPSTQAYNWALATQHSITLTGLTPNTTYQVMTESSYFTNPDLTSPIFTITTTGSAPPPAPDFTAALSPATSSVAPNSSASLALTTTALNGDSSPLTLECTAPASGCQISPATLAPGQTAAVTIAASALQSGANTITVSASDGVHTHTAAASVTVTMASGLPLPTVSQITSSGFTLTWTTAQALNTQVWYGPAQPTTHAYDWTLTTQHTITITGLTPDTTYQVQAESSNFTNPDLLSADFTVTTLGATAPPDFTVALTPASSSVGPNTAASLTLTATALNGDTNALTLSCTAPATGCQISPASITPGQTAKVSVAATALQSGANTITISANDGTNTHTASATVTVTAAPPPDFSLALSPATSTAAPGTAASLTVTSTAIGGDSSMLTLSCSAPATNCTVNPSNIAPGQSATVSIAATALQSGTNSITVAANDGTNTHTASAVVTVSSSSAGLPLPTVTQLTSTSITLSWTTAQALNTQVWYGPAQPTTHAYNWTLAMQHTITITGLTPNTTYFMQTESSYFTNPDLYSDVFTITTAP